ncbi:Cyclophilin type peptidyl-prolyl cis-trans isomerase/CLD [uncultured archaeon]|nr:Cyclophilin type peptidyl-prolyl cis-trans isomerase/CLD [uncultured archaeon]
MKLVLALCLLLAGALLMAGCFGEKPASAPLNATNGSANGTMAYSNQSGGQMNGSAQAGQANGSAQTPNAAGQMNPSGPDANAVGAAMNDSTRDGMMNPKNPVVVFETTKGNFSAEIYVNEAPITGANFMKLVNSGFYNGLTFHRVEPGFVVQGGDPKGDGTGGSNQTIPLEIKPNLKHKLGALGMARSQNPDSASSQFYVVTGEASFLDGNYAVFGQVLGSGMNVVQQIKVGDRMTKVYEKK